MDSTTLLALGPFIFITVFSLIGGAFGIIFYFYDKKRNPDSY